jgi:hypothetical protein
LNSQSKSAISTAVWQISELSKNPIYPHFSDLLSTLFPLVISNIFDIDNHGYVTEQNVRKLFATNLFAARNIIKPFDWEAYDAAKKSAEPASECLKALYGFTGTNDMELTFPEGAVMQLLQKVDADWWWCDYEDKQGYVPANYVELAKMPGSNKTTTKLSKFQTIKRGMEMEVLMFSLMKLANQNLGGKIPRDSFLQWALEHEMDLCLNALEKFDLRANKSANVTPVQETPAPAPPTGHAPTPTPTPVVVSTTSTTAVDGKSTLTSPPATTTTTSTSTSIADSAEVPANAIRSDSSESASRISPELATVLRAAGIADKELEDMDMATFVNYFIDKHAPKVGNEGTTTTTAGRRKPKTVKANDTIHRRPLPAPSSSDIGVPVAPAVPTVTITPSDDISTNHRVSLHDQIKAGKKLKASRKKTNLATLSKKDLTGLGLLLRVQIDSRRNFIAMSDEDDSSSDDDFE